MPLQHTPLDLSQLSPAVARIVGPAAPGSAKMMAARGMAPMGPKDLLTALYQLSLDVDAQVSAAAKKTAASLPENILGAALGEALDGRVLDFFAIQVVNDSALVEKALLNRAVHDETLIALAGLVGERESEILAGNQERLLRCPAIIESLYFNRHVRMSTIDRLLEMAVRNGITLEVIPQFKEIAANILGVVAAQPAAETSGGVDATQDLETMDALFESVLNEQWDQGSVGSQELEGDSQREEAVKQNWNDNSVNAKIRLATIGSVFHRALAIKDSNRTVALAAIQSPGVSEQEAARHAANRGLSEDVIRYIANRKDWQKNYQIKVNLVNNPKTPLANSMRLLTHLRPSDVKAVARSKNVPAALAQAAKSHSSRRR